MTMHMRYGYWLATLGCCGALLGCDGEQAIVQDDPTADLESGHAATWLGLKAEGGFNGDGLFRTETQVSQPQDLLFMPDGTAWFTDFNNFLIRRVLVDGTVQSMVGATDPVFPGDGPVSGITPDGAPGRDWQLNHPTNLLRNRDDSVLVVGWHNHKLLKVDPDDGFVKVICGGGAGYAGDGDVCAGKALFKQPSDATFDDEGNLYLIDQQNERVRRIDPAGVITTVAGTGVAGYMGDEGPANAAQFSWAVGSNPNPSGGIVYHDDKLYISDTEKDLIRVVDLDSGMIDRFAGTGEAGYTGNGGPARAARLNAPRDLEIGPDGDLYFADTDNGVVRAINLETNKIRTVVGTGTLGLDEEEGLPATETSLRRPFGIAFDPDGNLYVLDTLNDRVLKVAK
jgi:sugar lactone lactonase YvrE